MKKKSTVTDREPVHNRPCQCKHAYVHTHICHRPYHAYHRCGCIARQSCELATCMPCLPNFLLICAVSFARQGRPCQGKKIVVNDRMCSCAAGRSVIAITMYLCMRVRSMIAIASFVWSVSGARERGWRSMPAENLILVRHRVIYTCLDRLYEIIRSYG